MRVHSWDGNRLIQYLAREKFIRRLMRVVDLEQYILTTFLQV